MTLEFFTISLLNGVSYGLLLFMLSSGLTLIFSMMGVLNFAHTSFYMLGAYFGYTLSGVVASLPVRTGRPLPRAGESLSLGLLGGRGAVGVDVVVSKAIYYAPSGAPRQRVLEGIGRGIGSVAVHEFFH